MVQYLELLSQFVKTDFRLRYKNSYLGLLWVILKPLSHFLITYTVFSYILNLSPSYKLDLLLGLIIMLFMSEILLMGLSSIVNKGYIILKINFPKEIAVISSTSIALLDLFFNLIVFGIFALFNEFTISISGVFLFLISITTLFILGLGISFFSGIFFIKLRDLQNIFELLIQLSYWAAPVYYSSSMLPASIQEIQKYNPLTIILDSARKGLIHADTILLSDFTQLLVISLLSILLLILGITFFRKNIKKLAEYF